MSLLHPPVLSSYSGSLLAGRSARRTHDRYVQSNYLLDTRVHREAFEEKVVRIIMINHICSYSYMPTHSNQGRIDLPKAGRGHVNFRVGSINSKM